MIPAYLKCLLFVALPITLTGCGPSRTDAIAAIGRIGGIVKSEDGIVYGVDLSNTKVANADLAHLKAFTDLVELDLRNTQVSDAGMVHLEGLKKLSILHLSNSKVTGERVDELKESIPDCWIL